MYTLAQSRSRTTTHPRARTRHKRGQEETGAQRQRRYAAAAALALYCGLAAERGALIREARLSLTVQIQWPFWQHVSTAFLDGR